MNFYLNGNELENAVALTSKFSQPYPAVSVSGGAELEVNFSGRGDIPFVCHPPELRAKDFAGLIRARSLL